MSYDQKYKQTEITTFYIKINSLGTGERVGNPDLPGTW